MNSASARIGKSLDLLMRQIPFAGGDFAEYGQIGLGHVIEISYGLAIISEFIRGKSFETRTDGIPAAELRIAAGVV